jgi:hypothetical protein
MAACHEPIRWRRTDPDGVDRREPNGASRRSDPDKSYWTSMLASAERRLIAAAEIGIEAATARNAAREDRAVHGARHRQRRLALAWSLLKYLSIRCRGRHSNT